MTPETNSQPLALSDLPAVGHPLRGGAFAGIGMCVPRGVDQMSDIGAIGAGRLPLFGSAASDELERHRGSVEAHVESDELIWRLVALEARLWAAA